MILIIFASVKFHYSKIVKYVVDYNFYYCTRLLNFNYYCYFGDYNVKR